MYFFVGMSRFILVNNYFDSHAAAKVAANGKMPIDLYYLTPSAPCRATLMTARAVGVDLNLKVCNIMEGEHMKEEYMKVNSISFHKYMKKH